MAIACYRLEEHHEAFFVWHHAISRGLVGERGNTLLHVDTHPDLGVPRLRSALHGLERDPQSLYRFTFDELSCGDFIVPLLCQGVFDEVFWVRPDGKRSRSAVLAGSYEGKGTVLMLRPADASRRDDDMPDARQFLLRLQTVESSFPARPSVLLDIDLDYFSCADAVEPGARMEVTREEYESFMNDRHHLMRVNFGSRMSARIEEGKHYLCIGQYEGPHSLPRKVSEEEIRRRMERFVDFLAANRVQPRVITIARSRISGYTPLDQWQLIEALLLEQLSRLYELSVEDAGDLYARLVPDLSATAA